MRRICIMGTAPTYKLIPWDDPGLEIWALNDAHLLQLPRADRWFDLHPFDKMYFREKSKSIQATDKPPGMFLRPAGHLEWLKQQTIPVYLQEAPPDWPSARTFPHAEIVAKFGPHFASSPAWMIGLALLEGCDELHIYGIHLATEWEYIKQKPNMTYLLGLAQGMGVKVVIPPGCPLLTESHQYGYDVDPDVPKDEARRRMQLLEQERVALKTLPKPKWYQRTDPNRASRLAWVTAQVIDAQHGLQCVMAGQPPAGG